MTRQTTNRLLLAGLILACLQACIVVPSSTEGMTTWEVEPFKSSTPYNFIVKTTVGGKGSSALASTRVDDVSFAQALDGSLKAANLQDEHASASQTYVIEATLEELEQPVAGFSLSITSHVAYSVTNQESGENFLTETIVHTGNTELKDGIIWYNRARLANEKSIRGNIRQFIERIISKLKE